ncbi:glycosyl hydrolase family 95 catalytic domain-containing protein [Lysobacter sp. CA199]|uniref:glycosyl hydrolase family 95 catalytic domain-containing protein n=1 Tax=Lysobacter sp. CA199 TaxID=3455608 RepID=UPI003F8D62C6
MSDSFNCSRRTLLQLAGSLALARGLSWLPVADAKATPAHADATSRSLWYARSADEKQLLLDGLPLGNGHLGALLGGDAAQECLAITDGSLWQGRRNDEPDNEGQLPYEPFDASRFGSFALLAKLRLSLPTHAAPEDYRRELDLQQGCARVHYTKAGTRYRREAFVSHPDRVLVLRFTSEGSGDYQGTLALEGAHGERTLEAGPQPSDAHALGFEGRFENGLGYAAQMAIVADGGRVAVDGDVLRFDGCRALTVVLAAATNYAPAAPDFIDRKAEPIGVASQRIHAALAKPVQVLRDTHVADHRALFDTMQVNLGASSAAQRGLDTWARLQDRAKSQVPDPEFEATYLQFGRYLTIAGSRDGLPTNLQGLWITDNDLPWFSDYHTDINLQMNYWLPDRAGLGGQCFEALADYCVQRLEMWTQITRERFNDPRNRFRNTSGKVAGWSVAISLNAFGGNGWWWHPAGNAWLCLSLWEHWQYTLDRRYLEKIFPLLQGACEFWEARLIETEVRDADGTTRRMLVDDHDWSPEQGPQDARGIAYAQELVWALFGHYVEASRVLGRGTHHAAVVGRLRERLYLPRVLDDGVLEEWMGAHDLGEPRHRHLSHLIGLFPGDRIHGDTAPPALVAGARRALDLRGEDSYGWANAWRALCRARLREGDAAYDLLIANLAPWREGSKAMAGTSANLFDIYALGGKGIFQIDANFGAAAAMLEMLLYSRPGRIELLPALPRAWPRGKVTGIGARGGFVVDLAWRDGRAEEVRIRSVGGTEVELAHAGQVLPLRLESGQSVQLRVNAEGRLGYL